MPALEPPGENPGADVRPAITERILELEQVIENSPYAIAMFDRAMRYLFASARWIADYRLELSNEQLRGRCHYDIFPELPEHWRLVHRRSLSGEVVRSDAEAFTRRDGTVQWLRWEVRPYRDECGAVSGIVIFTQDITDDRRVEGERRDSEERFRSTFDNAAVGIAHVGLDGRWQRVNDKLCHITGYARDALLSLTFQDITYPDDLETDLAYVQAMIDGSIATYSLEKRYIRADGTLLWINLTVSLARSASGAPAYFISIVEDIHRRKAAESALRESESRFRMLADHMSQLAWMADAAGRRFWFNQRWVDYTGAADADPVDAGPQRRIAAGEPWTEIHQLAGQDGIVRWFMTQVVPLRDSHGTIYRWFGTSTDITLQREAERTRERARLFELSLDLVCIVTLDGYFVQTNPAFALVLGYSADELRGRSIAEPAHAEEVDAVAEALDRVAHGSDSEQFTCRYRCKDGRYRWLQWRLIPSGDGVIYAVARDVTSEREKQASLTASLKEREVLLQEVHHRVKNNLQVISSLINMQTRQLRDRVALEALGECRARVEAIALIHEKLYQTTDYARVPFGTYARGLASSVFRTQRANTGAIDLVLDVDDEVALPVGRAIPCGLILNELITNALKHAFPAGKDGSVTVSLHRHDRELLLAVADDGVGMPAGFDVQASKSLGMHLVTMLVRQLKGRLDVERSAGTSFRVSCSIDASAPGATSPTRGALPPVPGS